MILVHLREELIELIVRYDQSCTDKSCHEFPLVQLTIVITVNALEKLPEFFLRVLDKFPKFSIGRSAPVSQKEAFKRT